MIGKRAWLLLMAASLGFGSPGHAEELAPPGFALAQGTPVSIDAADRALRGRTIASRPAAALSTAVAAVAGASGCPGSSPIAEINALAAALKCDPDLIFEYVYNNIEYEPIFGSNKGPFGTLIDQRGSDLDQAQLFGALLIAAGFSSSQISYQYGYIRVAGTQGASWLGVKDDGNAIGVQLFNGGIPVNTAQWFVNGNGTLNRIDVAHVWVRVTIGGVNYMFDPSYKQHNVATGIPNLGAALGYSRSQFLSAAGGSITGTSIGGINKSGLRESLTAYANNMIGHIKTQNPAWSVNDVLGGKVIKPLVGSPMRQTSLPHLSPTQPTGFPQIWGSVVPNAYRTCFTVTMPGLPASTCAAPTSGTIQFYSDETYGHRITISSVPSGSNFIPTLLVDGAPPSNGTNMGTAAAFGANWSLNVAIMHPYTGSLAGFADQQRDLSITAGGFYLLGAGWGGVSRAMAEKHRNLLSQARAAGLSPASETVLGESLATIGYSWLAEEMTSEQLGDGIGKTSTLYHHGVGITAQTSIQGQAGTQGPYVDLPLNIVTITPQTYSSSPMPTDVAARFYASSGFSSALESAVLEQTQALIPGMQAASTIRLVDQNASTGVVTYFVDANSAPGLNNYFSTIRPLIAPAYIASDLAIIDGAVSTNGLSTGSPTGNQLLLPAAGNLAVGAWAGAGFTITKQTCPGAPLSCSISIRQLISGGLSGGFSGTNVPTLPIGDVPYLALTTALQMPAGSASLLPAAAFAAATAASNRLIADPVDGITGSYLYQHEDLATGSGGFPYALGFNRHYSSAAYLSDQGLGKGWSHGFDITAFRTSEPFVALGDRAAIGATTTSGSPYAASGESSAIAAASAIAATYVAQDLFSTGTLGPQNMTLGWMVQRWQTDQLTNNAVVVSTSDGSELFTALPRGDGASSITYVPPPGSSALVIGWQPDAYGQFTRFAYRSKDQSQLLFNAVDADATGRVSSWSFPNGMSLGFSYGYSQGGTDYLTRVSNGLGRTLDLSYSGTHISTVTDETGRGVGYGYDPAGNLAAFTDPLGKVTRFGYDRSGVYDTAGRLTEVRYPSGPDVPFVANWYDALGRVRAQADGAGNVSRFHIAGTRTEFVDGAGGRHVTYQSPRGKVLKDAWVLSSGFGNVFGDTAQQNGAVDVAANDHDGLSRLRLARAPEGGATAYTYSADGLNNVIQLVRSAKPGSPLTPLVTQTAYDPVYSRPVRITDPRGLVTRMDHDPATGNLVTLTADANNIAAVTRYAYDGRGLLVGRTDPLGVVTAYGYDAQGNRTSVTGDVGGLSQLTRYGYDAAGNVTSLTDPKGNSTRWMRERPAGYRAGAFPTG